MYLLETEKLGLRNLELADVQPLFEILSDPETMKYYPQPYTQKETENWIRRSIESYDARGFGLWGVVLKEEGKFIGQCGISILDIDGAQVPEIGYQINKNYWNRGYATELAAKCLAYGFTNLNLREIFIHTYIKNTPSIRVAEKTGMVKRKEYDKKVDQSGTIMRHVVYSIKKSEYCPCNNIAFS